MYYFDNYRVLLRFKQAQALSFKVTNYSNPKSFVKAFFYEPQRRSPKGYRSA